MSQHSEQSIRYYDDHADEYVADTLGVEMASLYGPFLQLLPEGGKILDAGCGSGRDTKAFFELGYDVISIDASEQMVEATTRLTGTPARHLFFQKIEFQNEFDGAWACASLLHVPRHEIDSVLKRIICSLRPRGILYMSFKEGNGERAQGDRRFTDFTSMGLETCIAGHSNIDIIRIWITDDVRRGRNERWVNALVRKETD